MLSQDGLTVCLSALGNVLTTLATAIQAKRFRVTVGRYEGGIWQRDRAYHQGRVWSWLIGSFIRAWQRVYPDQPIPDDWQPLLAHFQQDACLGSISEIFDGDSPHVARGAIAQAWSVAEVIQHWVES
ncbi:MAG: hypothetical protein HC769_30735 [Cyanobacteria bacterium CRU_2_1]|nr:hypothetical protein [Cyanobacteria bacterium RU_5_0]NJR62784.1 hypothetical protein [Cyanobacteria bacterium CRU_2_1]